MSIRPGSSSSSPASVPSVRLSRDYPRAVVEANRRRAVWERVGRGASVPASRHLERDARALAAIVAVHERLVSPHWFSHESAALIWGLPVWRVPAVTHVRQRGHPSARRDRAVLRHGGEVDDEHLTVVGRLPVTDLVQTMVDCARAATPVAGLVVADAALRAGANRADALAMLDAMPGHRGVARARVVVELADAGAESPGETATRFVLLRDGLPRPETQVPVVTRLGTFWADVGWDEWKVLLEYDGRSKYLDPDAFAREKRRQDAVVETGARLVRVTKEDIPRRAALPERVRSLLPRDLAPVRRPHLRG